MPTGGKASARKVNAEQNRAKALALRIRGATYAQIGEQLKVTTTSAHKYVRDGMAELNKVKLENAEEYRELELAKLDMFEAKLNSGELDLAAVGMLLRISERRCRLLGIDAPAKVEATGKDGAPLGYGVLRVPVISAEDWAKAVGAEAGG